MVWSQPKVERLIRLRSRMKPERLLEAARICNQRGWFWLSLRLLEGARFLGSETSDGFEGCWLAAQARAAVGDLVGAQEWMDRAHPSEIEQVRRRSSFQVIIALSLSDWERAEQAALELQGSESSAPILDITAIRTQVLMGVALLHGRRNFQESRRLWDGALANLRTARGLDETQVQALVRQIDFFRGQSYYFEGDLAQARSCWEQGKVRVQRDTDSLLFQHQFEILISLAGLREGKPEAMGEYFQAFTSACKSNSNPAEQFELYLALATTDVSLARQIWLSTRSEGLKKLIEREWGEALFSGGASEVTVALSPGGEVRSQGASEKAVTARKIDGWSGEPELGLAFKPGQATQRLFEALVLSCYSGLTLFELHQRVFEGEKFNPRSTPLKMRNLILRLRGLLAKSSLGLKLEEREQRYFLISGERVLVRFPWTPIRGSRELAATHPQVYRQISILAHRFGDQYFTLKEALPLLGLARSRASELFQAALGHGCLERKVGQRSTVYRCRLSV